jgi:acetyl esterase/lipase
MNAPRLSPHFLTRRFSVDSCRRIPFLVLFGVLALAPEAAQAELPYVQHKDVVFADAYGLALVMDIFVPKENANGLGIIDVASGAWHSNRGKIKDHERARFYDIFGRKGYTVFAIRPGSITKFTAPEMLANLKQGIRWVKTHAAEYNIDADRLGITGASAGGHLACLAAVTADDAKEDQPGTDVKACAVFFPPTDLVQFRTESFDPKSDLIRALAIPRDGKHNDLTTEKIEELVTQISPARLVTEKAPPFLLIHGDADPLVPLNQSEKMLTALKEKKIPAELIVKPGGGHPWLTIHEEVQVLADWFDGKLSGTAAGN